MSLLKSKWKYKLLNGSLVSSKLKEELKNKHQESIQKNNKQDVPHLAIVLCGDDPASLVYINHKQKACREMQWLSTLYHLSNQVSTTEVLKVIHQINEDDSIHGLIVQLPLPPQVDKNCIVNAIDYLKDVDGFHPCNIGNLVLNQPYMIPATPQGIKFLIDFYEIETKGRHCVVIGKGLIVGQPLANLLALEKESGATVTSCDQYTNRDDLRLLCQNADILIVCAGVHHLINDPDMIKDGCVVIDVGIHRIEDASKKNGYRLEGDVDFYSIVGKCKYITPVPGGVGPMTVTALLYNLWLAYHHQTTKT